MNSRWKIGGLAVTLAVLVGFTVMLTSIVGQTNPTKVGDWPMYGHDLTGARFSPLTQITTGNVAKLQSAWVYALRTEAERARPAAGFSFTTVSPIVVNGTMYLTAGNRVLALDPDTGKEVWRYTLPTGNPSARGVSYWPGEGNTPARIVFTAARRMIALSASDGVPVPAFGNNGEVDMVVPYNSPPTVFKNLLIVGANVPESPATGQPGDTRAYDARTGAKVWEFHSIPQPGEVGNETWEGEAWKNRTGANNWGFFMTLDTERGTLYTVFGSPASDFYGGDRKGNNLFGNSVVALDAATGKHKWHFQTVHHDLWDMDLPPAPVLVDITVRGRTIPALAQTGKLGYIFILNRVTGEPVFGVDEKPVPASKVPGEHSSPTQPVPVKPQALGRHSFEMKDLVTASDTTAEHAKACRDLVEKSGTFVNEGPYTPYAYRETPDKGPSSVIFPGAIGGTDWGGMSSDPRSGYLFVNVSNYGSIGWIQKSRAGAAVTYEQVSVYGNPVASKFWDRQVDAQNRLKGEASWPCQKPPWGLLVAVNANTGDIEWQTALGVTDELPEGKKNTGRVNLGGSIATAGGLVFIGATNDRRFRAFDAKNGKELWSVKMDYSAISTPISYEGRSGKQYVAITASGGGGLTDPNPANSESLYVFALP